jgi:hypothetical protein
MGRSSHHIAWRCIRAGAIRLTLWAGVATYVERRASMVETIDLYAMLSKDALGRDYLDPRVMEVMGIVPRHAFLREEKALPICGDITRYSHQQRRPGKE